MDRNKNTKKKLMVRGILLLAFIAVLGFNYDRIYRSIFNIMNPIDAIYEYDGQHVSIRGLFEANYEEIHYASHLGVSCSSGSSSSQTRVSESTGINMGNGSSSSSNEFQYDRYYVDDNNYMWVVSGKINSTDSYSSILGDTTDKSSTSEYKYYKGMEAGVEKTAYEYIGSKTRTCLDVEKILLPDLSEMSDVNVFFDGKPDEEGHFVITFKGKKLSFLEEAFKGGSFTSDSFTEIKYIFDAESRKLLAVKLSGERDYAINNGTGHMSRSMSLMVTKLTYGDVDNIDIPEFLCENSTINDVLTEKTIIEPSPMLTIVYESGSEKESAVNSIWHEGLSDMTEVKKSYAIFDKDEGLFLRYTYYREGEELGSIIVPLVVSGNRIINSNNLYVSPDDMVTIGSHGSVWVTHDISSTITGQTCYKIDKEGKLSFNYSVTKEAKVSNLLDEEELSLYSEDDIEALKRLATDYEQAKFASMDRYEILKNDALNVYYVLDVNDDLDKLTNEYGVSFISQKKADKMISTGYEGIIEWQSMED
ncbi:hypothetical protein [Butyrivibrio sp. VCB2006]|uniref:hypothetical protein n=1 Tax=Butyrivibrio sp. VCB2006 TaxID=1280679 RepID=UPI000408F49B|nr:hypothetical protein [Butyrivibrio sp. VCB2006]